MDELPVSLSPRRASTRVKPPKAPPPAPVPKARARKAIQEQAPASFGPIITPIALAPRSPPALAPRSPPGSKSPSPPEQVEAQAQEAQEADIQAAPGSPGVPGTRKENAIYSYFIGRLNPPHSGHIKTIMDLLKKTAAYKLAGIHSKALILLGSGPGSQQTQDDPLDFILKSEFLKNKLIKELHFEKITYPLYELCEIQEIKISQTSNVCEFIARQTERLDPRKMNTVEVVHYAGNKGDDATKLKFIQPFVRRLLETKFSPKRIIVRTSSIEAETVVLPPKEKSPVSSDFAVVGTSLKKEDAAMSATKVRNDAYQQSEEFWKTKYRPFYKIEYDEAD